MTSRYDYVKYDALAQDLQSKVKTELVAIEALFNSVVACAHRALDVLENLPECRSTELAYAKLEELGTTPCRDTEKQVQLLEEAYMWVGKAIRDDQIKRNGAAELQEGRNNE